MGTEWKAPLGTRDGEGGEAAPLCTDASDVVMTSALSSFPQLILLRNKSDTYSVTCVKSGLIR